MPSPSRDLALTVLASGWIIVFGAAIWFWARWGWRRVGPRRARFSTDAELSAEAAALSDLRTEVSALRDELRASRLRWMA